MPNTEEIFRDIMEQVEHQHGAKLDQPAREACRQIFEGTLGTFFRKNPTADDGEHERIRKFIFGQVRRIIAAAKEQAAGGTITSDIVYRSAMGVMTNTRRILDEALSMAEGDLMIGKKSLAKSYCHGLILERHP